MDTINTIEFREEVSQEDTSFHVEENSQEEQASVGSIESMEEQSQEPEEEAAHEDEPSDEEDLDMEQIPLGVDKITMERGGKIIEGEQLVFSNPETDLPVQTINELDSQDLDDDQDASFRPDAHPESPSQAEDEACEDSERESVDNEDLNGVMMKLGSDNNNKLIFPEGEVEVSAEHDTNEEMPSATHEKEYIEEEDPDFNPAYCGETLSDCEDEQEGDEEAQPEVIALTEDGCIMKVDPMLIPPPHEEEAEEMVQAEAPMDCE